MPDSDPVVPSVADVHQMSAELVALRRDLHAMPEVGLDLPNTQARLLRELANLPLEVTTGESLTSITAVLRGGSRAQDDAPVVLLRADMDALPVAEETGLEYASTNGAMHACGHDLHMTMLVGALKALCARRDELAGDVVFMFQPGEEGHDGAGHMLAEGVLDAAGRRPDAAYAIHVWSALEPFGTVCVKPGAIMSACDRLDVTVVGKGGHGSAPHGAADPVPAMCEMVTAMQVMLSRRFDVADPAVITVGSIHAGTTRNVIPERGTFEATLRSFSPATQASLFEKVPALLRGIADAHGVTVEVDLAHVYPVTANDPDETAFVADVAADIAGDAVAHWTHSMAASEDFSRVLEQVPGSFIGLSAVPEGVEHDSAPFNHSAYAVFDDAVLARGAELFVELTTRRLRALAAGADHQEA